MENVANYDYESMYQKCIKNDPVPWYYILTRIIHDK